MRLSDITNNTTTGMFAEDLHRLERNSYQTWFYFHTFVYSVIYLKWPTSFVRKKKPLTLDLAKLLHGSFYETRNLGLKLRKRWKSTEITMRNKKWVVSDNQEDWWAPSYTEGTALMWKMSTHIIQNCLFGLVRPPPKKTKNKNLENLSESHNLEKFTMHSGSISLTVSAPKSLMTKAAREPSMEGGENRFDYPTGT